MTILIYHAKTLTRPPNLARPFLNGLDYYTIVDITNDKLNLYSSKESSQNLVKISKTNISVLSQIHSNAHVKIKLEYNSIDRNGNGK